MSLVRCGRLVPLMLRRNAIREAPRRHMSGFANYWKSVTKEVQYYRNDLNLFDHPGWRLQNRLRSILSFFVYSWIFWHLYYEYDHWWGAEQDESRIDYTKFTDEELGIPPDEDDDVYPANYIPAAELNKQ